MKNKRKLHFYSTKSLAKELGLSEDFLVRVYAQQSSMYRKTMATIKGKKRLLHLSDSDLTKVLQKIQDKILNRLDFPTSFQGGIKGRSLRTNAQIHLGASSILKLDIKDFFPTITPARVMQAMKKIGMNTECARIISGIVTVGEPEPHLPQGFITSPKVAALTLLGAESELHRLAKKHNWNYSIWADDITISSKASVKDFKNIVTRIFENRGFIINKRKTETKTKNGRMLVNGVLINKHPNTPKSSRDFLRQHLNFLSKYGVEAYMVHKKIPLTLDNLKEIKQSLRGKVNYTIGINELLGKKFKKQFETIKWKV